MADERVEIELAINQVGDAVKGLQTLIDGTKQLGTAEEEYQKKLARTLQLRNEEKRLAMDMAAIDRRARMESAAAQRAGMSGTQRFMQGAEGMAGQVTGFVPAAANRTAAALSKLASAIETMGSGALTTSEKFGKLASSLPILGPFFEALQSFIDAVSGKAERLRLSAIAFERMRVRGASLIGFEASVNPHIAALAQAHAGAEARQALSVRGGFQGNITDPIAYRQWEARAGSSAARRAATAGILGATGTAEAARKRAAAHGEESQEYSRRAMGFVGQLGSGTLNQQIEAMRNASSHQALAMAASTQQAAELNRLQASTLQLVQAESALRKANIQDDRERLGILKEQEERVRGQYHAWAGMTRGGQQMALRAARQAQARGAGSLRLPQLHALSAGGATEFVNREMERRAGADPGNAEFRRLTGQQGNLGAILQEKVALAAKIELDVKIDEDKLARALKEVMADQLFQFRALAVRVASEQRIHAEIERMLRFFAGRGE